MMKKDKHFIALENMYLSAPINNIYKPRINIWEGQSEIEIDLNEDYFHPVGAVHGSVYFKMLDDSAFFAVNSLEREVFVLTASFTTYLTRPVSFGVMRAVGKILNSTKNQFIAESVAYNSEGKEIARGNGIFVRGKVKLSEVPGYKA